MRTSILALLFSCFFTSSASAHIELLDPIARYPLSISGANKACPCGVGLSNRLCDVPGDRSDPDRSTDRVTTLTAGSTITMRFDEYIGHAGRYRIAIDYDGADLADFNANILLDVPDPSGSAGNIGQGSIWELDFTLPDVVCDNCTLQLIQMMDGNTTDPVPDPIGRSSYYTCADIVLVRENGTPDAGPPADAGPPGDANLTPDAPCADATCQPEPDADCGCRTGGDEAPLWIVTTALGLCVILRRRSQPTPG